MTKPRFHQLDVYGVQIALATEKKAWAKLRRRFSFLDQVPSAMGHTDFAVWEPTQPGPPKPSLVFWVDLAAHDDDAELVNTCAHEAAHGAGRVFEWIGHSVPATDEPSAYLIGWLTEWLWSGCAEHRTS